MFFRWACNHTGKSWKFSQWFLLSYTALSVSSVTQSCPALSDPVACSTPGFLVHPQLLELAQSNSCPVSQWCHPTISSSVVPFSSCLQSFPASGSFPILGTFQSIIWNVFLGFPYHTLYFWALVAICCLSSTILYVCFLQKHSYYIIHSRHLHICWMNEWGWMTRLYALLSGPILSAEVFLWAVIFQSFINTKVFFREKWALC